MKFHDLANIFPLLEGDDFQALVDDVRENVLHEPIVVYDDQILDGRNRYRACVEANVEPRFVPYLGDDPVAFVVSLNLRRRHLNESQRAMVAGRLATLKLGDNQYTVGSANLQTQSQAAAAELLNVSPRSVASARTVIEHGLPELAAMVDRADVAVSAAAEIATQPAEQQQEIV